MNFASTERTGRLGEIDVERLFITWSWTVGKDLIDVGYDLTVEPDIAEFGGHRFLVQAKATAENKKHGNVIAPIAKSRLRQYARNPIPVFIVRVTGDGALYWLHVQDWATAHGKRLSGDGTARINIPKTQRLEDKDDFVAYLKQIFKPLAEKSTALADLAMEREQHLSSIDPRLAVKVEVKNGHESYHLAPKDHSVKVAFELTLAGSQRGAEQLAESVRFGTPAEIDGVSIRFGGSALMTELGMDDSNVGILSITPSTTTKAIVRIYPGEKYTINSAPPLSFNCRKYAGQGGIAFDPEEDSSLFTFQARLLREGKTTLTLSYREDSIYKRPLRELDDLGQIGDWAHEVLSVRTMRLEFCFEHKRIPMTASEFDVKKLSPLLAYASTLGRLSRVARALDSEFVLPRDFAFSLEDMRDVNLAYNLLKGERCPVLIGPITIGSAALPTDLTSAVFRLDTTLQFIVAGTDLGTIPVSVDLRNFHSEIDQQSGELRMSQGDEGSAFAFFHSRELRQAEDN